MFIIILTYTKPEEVVAKYRAEHREFLDLHYKQNNLVVSGPQVPLKGGAMVSQLTNRAKVEAIVHDDPFYIHDIASYEIIEFNPVKVHPDFKKFISS